MYPWRLHAFPWSHGAPENFLYTAFPGAFCSEECGLRMAPDAKICFVCGAIIKGTYFAVDGMYAAHALPPPPRQACVFALPAIGMQAAQSHVASANVVHARQKLSRTFQGSIAQVSVASVLLQSPNL